MPDDAYPPEAIHLLAGMEPRKPGALIGDEHYPVEDGPGSSDRVELAVRVLVGTERSTIIVADPVTGAPLEREVVQHGGEAGAAAGAVYAALKKRNARL